MKPEPCDSDDTKVPAIIPQFFCSQEICDLLLAGLTHLYTSPFLWDGWESSPNAEGSWDARATPYQAGDVQLSGVTQREATLAPATPYHGRRDAGFPFREGLLRNGCPGVSYMGSQVLRFCSQYITWLIAPVF